MANESLTCHMTNEKRLDLIDRSKLFEKEYNASPLKALQFAEMVVSVRDIEDAPTVDAVEVVHGKWIHASNKPGVWIGMKCSLCAARIRYSEFINGNHNYCHKCGAKMDGDGNG